MEIRNINLLNVIESNNERSKKIIRNVFLSFGVKGGTILISLMVIPLTIDYINSVQYGIWLTISSIINWLNFFDIGLGNGLRNKLTAALALNKVEEAKVYVSTTYAVLICISVVLGITFLMVNSYINWIAFLNIPTNIKVDIQLIIQIVILMFCLNLVVQLINAILIANHMPAKSGLVNFLSQLFVLITIYILKRHVEGNLTILVFTLTAIPLTTLIFVSIYFYKFDLKHIAPSFKAIDFTHAKSLLGTGGSFFIIQIGALILYQTSNVIISKLIGPGAVTEYNVSYKLFAVSSMTFSLIITPYWSAFTEAFAKNDFEWMKKSVKTLRLFWLILSFLLVPMILLFSETLYKFWVGNAVKVPFSLSLSVALYTICFSCMNLNCYFLNGIGKIRMQLYAYVMVCIINIPLSFILGSYFGTPGIVISNALVMILINIMLWTQTNKILNQTAEGIWNK